MGVYYTLDKIKKIKDLDGKKPSMFLISSNRSAGKTTAVLNEFIKCFLEDESQFAIIYRNQYEMSDAHNIFADILEREYPSFTMFTKSCAKGLFYQLILNDGESERVCGFALGLFSVDKMKKYSPLFLHVERALFDEYQLENGRYLKNEPQKLMSLIISIARGGGSQSRNIDLYMLSNNISILNPYYISLGITQRLMDDTRFLRGHGWVLEQGYNASANKAVSENNIVRAFSESDSAFTEYMTAKNSYLINMSAFIKKQTGRSRYLCTIEYGDKKIGVREFFESGEIHCNEKVDPSAYYTFAFTPENHSQNTVMLKRSSFIFKTLEKAYDDAYLTFETVEIKNIIFLLLGIDLYG